MLTLFIIGIVFAIGIIALLTVTGLSLVVGDILIALFVIGIPFKIKNLLSKRN